MNNSDPQPLNIDWTDETDDPECPRLYAWVSVNGCYVHFEAYEVEETENGQEAVSPAWQEEHEFLCARADGALETFKYEGRHFVIFATSFGA